MIYKNILRPLLFQLDPESAHNLTYKIARMLGHSEGLSNVVRQYFAHTEPSLNQHIFGLQFENPVGLAAGFDKNGHLPYAIFATGFGFTEIGSITAQPSVGNPKPRVFRLATDQALINRMGLNNDGAEVIVRRLQSMPRPPFPVGINIAKTHNPKILGDLAIADYLNSYRHAQAYADYVMINISCPNTEEGKTFEDPAALTALLEKLHELRLTSQKHIPILVKFSADLDRSTLAALLEITERYQIDGYAAVNTSAARTYLPNTPLALTNKAGRGGLSGIPLRERSEQTVRWIYEYTNGTKPIIGIGGVFAADDAIALIRAGASLIQLYTGLIYEGPRLPYRINQGIATYLKEHGYESISAIRGTKQ